MQKSEIFLPKLILVQVDMDVGGAALNLEWKLSCAKTGLKKRWIGHYWEMICILKRSRLKENKGKLVVQCLKGNFRSSKKE